MPTASSLPNRLVGAILKQLWASKNGSVSSWLDGSFTPHMAAARRAILERILLVDLTIEVRDARLPISSAFEPMRHISSSHKRIVVLNKVDLADRSLTEEWIKYFEERNCVCYAVNSHNKDNIKEFLHFVRARTRELKKDESDYTATVMLVGIPNAGKSAIANSMHQIGRISAAEKGKLKHAVVSPLAGETKDISSLKIASHPNIYVLDTPGVLSPEIPDVETGFKLALTGAIRTCLVGECELARYFLAIFNSGNEYKRWESLTLTSNHREQILGSSDSDEIRRGHYPSDHTQDFIVNDARRTLFRSISSIKGNLETETEMAGLIEAQFAALHEVFRVPLESSEDGYRKVAAKLLNLYRTGRLGRYTLDSMQ